MSLFPFFQWLQQTNFATALRESALVYPTVMATHLSGMALFGGMIFLTDLRILGLAMRTDASEYQSGDFLIRNILGMDPQSGALWVSANVPARSFNLPFTRSIAT